MADQLPVSICDVATADGTKHYVMLLPIDTAFKEGLVPEAIVGALSDQWEPATPITPAVFARNSVFVKFLHAVIARHGPNDPRFLAEAKRLGAGWVYIIDQRTPTPNDEVPPEDIIGAFEVRAGTAVPESYRPNSKHRILSENGFFRLGAALQKCLLAEITALNNRRSDDRGCGLRPR